MIPARADADDPVARYFSESYPDRRAVGARLFRRNDRDLAALVRERLAGSTVRRILDLGCGDGMMLRSALSAPVEAIKVVDLAERNVSQAITALRPLAGRVTGHTGDVRGFAVAGEDADLVLLLGVLDYLPDWRTVLARTAAATRGRLFVNVPRSDRFWHRLRRIRLRRHGIALTTAGEQELSDAFEGLPGRARIFGDRLSWYADYEAD